MNIGTIRRIDDLGRIVLPKSLRKSLRIKNGDNLEIFTDGTNIILSKHSELEKIKEIGEIIIDTLKELISEEIYITDKDKIIISSVKENNNEISDEIIKIIENRKEITAESINLIQNKSEKGTYIIYPIIINGDTYGSLIIKKTKPLEEYKLNIINIFIKFLTKVIE